MSRALYRQYRSKTLSEVIGQEHITKTLTNALKKGSVSHAYLFTGPRGVGKTSVARILAHEVNGLPYDGSTHLDIIEIDAASNRRIDEIRELRDKVHIAPTSAKYKVYIIDEVHMLTREAFNALLKTLEEPPEHVIFILATTEVHKVPETIISRTQRFSFKPIDEDAAMKHLKSIADKEKLTINDAALRLIARHGNGSFRDSISMLDQLAGLDNGKIDEQTVATLLGVPDDTLVKQLLDSIVESDVAGLFDTTASFREQGVTPAQLAKSIIDSLREQLLSGGSRTPQQQAVKLMKDLLPATGVQASYELIEIALLDSIPLKETSIQQPNKKPEEKATQPEQVIKEETADEEPAPIVEVGQEESEETGPIKDHLESKPENKESAEGQWAEVLNNIKGRHNTLYGILRMALAELTDDKLTLTFKFEFHRKQLQQNKHMDILRDVVVTVLGRQHELVVNTDKTIQPDKPAAEKKPQNAALSSVSNIFGGAELLES